MWYLSVRLCNRFFRGEYFSLFDINIGFFFFFIANSLEFYYEWFSVRKNIESNGISHESTGKKKKMKVQELPFRQKLH